MSNLLKMYINRIILLFFSLFLLTNIVYGQDTISLKKKPKVILKSWYPEYKEFPKLKIGKGKILFTIIPGFEVLNRNDIDLKTNNTQVQIEETIKENQYLVTVNTTVVKYIELEVWLDLENKTILINQNGKWKNAVEIYKLDGNRILIDTVKLELEK
jgi:hypothetical protein